MIANHIPLSAHLFIVSFLICNIYAHNQHSNKIFAEIAYGELVDKITILEIKSERITDPEKLVNIHTELASLNKTYQAYIGNSDEIIQLKNQLKCVNEILWNIEDALRAKERDQQFDDEFIKLAREVYINNDHRVAIKRQINILLGSHILEEKSYVDYHIQKQ